MPYSRTDLRRMANGLRETPPQGVSACMDFLTSESVDIGHGRARALISRRLKHVPLEPGESARLVACILGRLRSGQFSEQFRDQIRLALHLDATATVTAAQACVDHPRAYVRRQARWILHSRSSVPRPA